ncbi:hypothetical protein LJB83_01635 [Clostridia bacterium OttesenSCG-928-F22]|nr:hypothetical protein [Clostridia bacterium OttesenSCG-928-F22]
MDEVIRQIYNGEIQPCEGTYPDSEEYRELRQEHDAILDELADMIDDRAFELVEDLLTVRVLMDSVSVEDMFVYGFKLGMRVLLEALYNS